MSMLLFFRQNMKMIFVITIAGFVVATFAGFGGYYIAKSREAVAKVNGDSIGLDEFNRAYNIAVMSETQKGKVLNDEERKRMQNDIVQMLLQERLMIREAEQWRFDASEREVASVIAGYPLFQSNGRFDHATYYKNLRYVVGQTPEEFEKKTKDEVLTNKLKLTIADTIKVSDKELELVYAIMNKGDMSNFARDKEAFAQQYVGEKKMALLNGWFRAIADSAKVSVYLKDEKPAKKMQNT